MYESELYSVIVNLVTNSIKAVGTTSDTAKVFWSKEARPMVEFGSEYMMTGLAFQTIKDAAFEPVSDPAENMYEGLSEQMP